MDSRTRPFLPNLPVAVLIVSVLLVALLWGILLAEEQRNRQAIRENATRETGNLARAYEEHVLSSLRQIDAVLRLLRQDWRSDRGSFDHRVHSMQAIDDALLVQVAVIGADGRLAYTSLDPSPPPVDLSDREHFRVHQAAVRDQLFISKPVLGRVSGRYSLQMTRPILGEQGRFEGVLVISLSPDYFARFFASVYLGERGALLLAGSDGILRAYGRRGQLEVEAMGTVLPDDMPFFQTQTDRAGAFESRSPIDGLEKLFVYRRPADYPLIFAVALPLDEIFAEHRERWFRYRLWGGLFSLMALVSGGLLARALALQQRLRGQLMFLNDSLRTLNHIAADPMHTPMQKVQAALELGCAHLCADFAVLVSLADRGVEQVTCGGAKPLHTDDADWSALVDHCVAAAIEHDDLVVLRDEPVSQPAWPVETEAPWPGMRIGIPVRVAGEVYGALGFIAMSPTCTVPDDSDLEFFRLLARWVGSVLSEKQSIEALERIASTDALTGALSRGAFMRAMDAELGRAARNGQSVSMVLLDLDHFKRINDEHGHPVGDEVLRGLARLAQGMLRSGDHFARLGGEEFVALLPDTALAEALDVAERLRQHVAEASLGGESDVVVTVSAGVGEIRAGEDFTRFYNRVDAALYQAKEGGRNRVEASATEALEVR